MKYVVSVISVYCFVDDVMAWHTEYDSYGPYNMADQMRHLIEAGI